MTGSKFTPTSKVIDIAPRRDDAMKPAELIQVTGHQELTLNARRAITVLWHAAHMQGIEEGKDYHIETDRLKPIDHKGNEMVEEAIEALMRTLITVRLPDGRTRRVAFLGGNDLDDPSRPDGMLAYSFDKRLIEVLEDSTIWGKISIPILMAFSSKYAVSLYENVAKMKGLSFKSMQEYTLEDFRDLLGVQPGKYKTYGELNKHVIKPVAREINALANFNISIVARKTGRRVSHVTVGWWAKSEDEEKAAWQEVKRHKAGRRARIADQDEMAGVIMPSEISMRRKDPFLKQSRKGSPKTS